MSDFSKFGISHSPGGSGGILQPKLTYKFRVTFSGFGDGNLLRELTQGVQKITRPSFKHDVATVHSYNSRIHVAGKHEWEDVTLTCRDSLDNSVIAATGAQIQKQFNHYEQLSAVSGMDYKFGMEIQTLDGTDANPVDIWVLEGCWLTNVKYGEADYTQTNALQLVEMTIKFDNAYHAEGGSSLPTVGGAPFPEDLGGASGGILGSGGFS